MQTFFPLPSIVDSVKTLDWRRLGKQRVEAMQILNILNGTQKTNGWINHPAVKMWKGYELALGAYKDACILEWIARGYNNTMQLSLTTGKMPPWLGDEKFHSSHRSNLLRKDQKWYSQFGWSEPIDLPYIWPTK